jgi:hypothetical protein
MNRMTDAIGRSLKLWMALAFRGWRIFLMATAGSIWTLSLAAFGGGRLRHDLPEDAEIRYDETYRYAEAAQSVYKHDSVQSDLVDGFTVENGWETQVFDLPGHSGRAFLLTNHEQNRQIIASRGTATWANVKANVEYKKEMFDDVGCHLHPGFKRCADETWAVVKPRLIKNYWLSMTGHSLGGAIAVIVGMLAKRDGFTVSKVVTFGQPKVTNYKGAVRWDTDNDFPLTRVVHSSDSVPLVPPPMTPKAIKHGTYWHFGTELWFDNTGSQETLTPAAAHISGHTDYLYQTIIFERIPFSGVRSHSMVGYRKAMWRWVPRSKRKSEKPTT